MAKRSKPKTNQGKGGGRPSPYEGKELEIAKAVADRLRMGEPMAVICRDEGMPSRFALMEWQDKYPEVGQLIARAREDGFDAIAAECLAIADETSYDTITKDDGHEVQNSEWIARSKVRIETRLKLLAKWDPKRYGEKIEVDQKVSGEIKHHVTITEERRKELMDRRQAAIKLGQS